jgi:hypothetical protein
MWRAPRVKNASECSIFSHACHGGIDFDQEWRQVASHTQQENR